MNKDKPELLSDLIEIAVDIQIRTVCPPPPVPERYSQLIMFTIKRWAVARTMLLLIEAKKEAKGGVDTGEFLHIFDGIIKEEIKGMYELMLIYLKGERNDT